MALDGYLVQRAVLPNGDERLVLVDQGGRLHQASVWLASLADANRRPNTIKAYAARIGKYLSWTSSTADWRSIGISHIYLWRRSLAAPYVDRFGRTCVRSPQTIGLWITPLRAFYEWADAEGLVTTEVAKHMTQMRYFAAGTNAGGEHGRWKKSLAPELRTPSTAQAPEPTWISVAGARRHLLDMSLNARDRFLVDLLYFTGIRIGEALSLFSEDIHFGGAPDGSGCVEASAHFHVGMHCDTENDASAKRGSRILYVTDRVIDSYIDYLGDRAKLPSWRAQSKHLFVNLYANDEQNGRAMSYSAVRKMILRCGERIGFSLSGPHVLRHTLATRLVRGIECEKVPIEVVQAILGHSSLSSTRIYTHDLESAKREAMRAQNVRTIKLGGLVG